MGIKLKTICVTVSKLNTQPHDQVLSSSFPLESVSVNHWAMQWSIILGTPYKTAPKIQNNCNTVHSSGHAGVYAYQ